MSKYAGLRDDDWPPIVPRDRAGTLVRRLLVCTAVGIAMAVMVYLCACDSLRHAPGYRPEVSEEFRFLRYLKSALDDRRKQNGNYPEKLADLKAAHPRHLDEKGQVVDSWGNPYMYQSDGNTYTLISFGRDGKRGGDGMDQDIDARVVRSSEEDFFEFPDVGVPTLRQFVYEFGTGGVPLASALAGICAFAACFIAWKPDRRRLLLRAAGLALTLTVCFVTGFFMCAVHVPNHH